MISVYYARKIGEKYVLGLYADTEEDLVNLDISKPIGMYGVPGVGTTITLTANTNTANYYISKDGSLVEIETGTPVPPEVLTPFAVGDTVAGLDFGNYSDGDINPAIDEFLTNLTYPEEGVLNIVSLEPHEGSEFTGLQAVNIEMLSEGMFSGYGLIASVPNLGDIWVYSTVAFEVEGAPVYRGFQNLLDGKVGILTCGVVELLDIASLNWNGVIVGEVSGDAPIYSITLNITNGTAQKIDGIVPNEKVAIIINPDFGYNMPENIDVSGAQYTWSDVHERFIIFNATGNVTVTATCPPQA